MWQSSAANVKYSILNLAHVLYIVIEPIHLLSLHTFLHHLHSQFHFRFHLYSCASGHVNHLCCCIIIHSLRGINLMNHARIRILRCNIQLGLKHNMDDKETLGLENLGLEKPAPWNANRRATKAEGKYPSELQQASDQYSPSGPIIISSCHLPLFPSNQPLPIAPIGIFAGTLNRWSSQDYHHGLSQTSPAITRHVHVPPSDLPSASRSQDEPIPGNERSRPPRVTEVSFIQFRISCITTLESRMSVLMYCALQSSPVNKQHRLPLPLAEAAPIQRPISRPRRSYHSTQTSDVQITPHATHNASPSVIDSNDGLIHLPPPSPTSAYLNDAHAISNLLPSPQRLLLVLDLNGTLLWRRRKSQKYTPRPCLPKFLEYAFTNHSVLIWSSAQPHSTSISEQLLPICPSS